MLATRYLKAQKNLHHSFLLILPSLISLGVDADVLLYPMILLILLSLGVDVDVLLYPMILSILPSLGVDVHVLLYPMILPIPPSLGLDVLVYLMHRYRIWLPLVTLCPRHTT